MHVSAGGDERFAAQTDGANWAVQVSGNDARKKRGGQKFLGIRHVAMHTLGQFSLFARFGDGMSPETHVEHSEVPSILLPLASGLFSACCPESHGFQGTDGGGTATRNMTSIL